MKLGITTHFDAAHSLARHPGKCKQLHGHTYRVDIVVDGEQQEETGCVADFGELKAVIADVLELVDHTYLNEVLGYPTSENIALFLKAELEQRFQNSKLGVSLHSVRVWEARDKWVMVERE